MLRQQILTEYIIPGTREQYAMDPTGMGVTNVLVRGFKEGFRDRYGEGREDYRLPIIKGSDKVRT